MTPSEKSIYSFVNVRQPRPLDLSTTSGLHILYDNSNSSDFYTDLESTLTENDILAEMISEAQSFHQSPAHFGNENEIFISLPWYQEMRDYINENILTLTKNGLEVQFEASIGAPVGSYVSQTGYSELKNKLWDTIFVNLILELSPEIIELCQQALRHLNFLELLDDDTSQLLDTSSGLASLNEAQIVLPAPVFPLPKSLIQETPSQSSGSTLDQSAVYQEIEEYQNAGSDLIRVLKVQINEMTLQRPLTEQQFCAMISYDPETEPPFSQLDPADCKTLYQEYLAKRRTSLLSTKSFGKLKANTKTVLTKLSIANDAVRVPFVTSCIEDHIKGLYQSLNISTQGQRVMLVGGSLVTVLSTSDYGLFEYSGDPNLDISNRPFATPLGVGDLIVVTEKLKRYEIGEIAHLENIMAGENKVRTHRNLKISEEENTETTDYQVTTENDTQSTERYEVANEVAEMTSESEQVSAGLSVSGSYGTVRATSTASYGSQNSNLQSSMSATREARELTERASQRVTSKTVAGRRTLSRNEIEVINEHGLKNESGENHVVGMYHWVNKVMEARAINKGKRLMYEFFVPEPAAFYIFSQLNAKSTNPSLVKPVEPFHELESGIVRDFNLIDRYNYGTWAARYDVTDIETPPNEFITVSKSFSKDLPAGTDYLTLNDDGIEIPEGYRALNARVAVSLSGGGNHYVMINIAGEQIPFPNTGTEDLPLDVNHHTGVVPISMRSRGTQWAVNVVIECVLTDSAYDAWKLQTFRRIMENYETKLYRYKGELESLKSSVEIQGRNPLLNRDIEKTELKKACIKLFSGQRFDGFDSMRIIQEIDGPDGKVSFPDFDFIESIQEGRVAMFFEEAFEWDNITYQLYPYYYSRKANWLNIMSLQDNDVKFEKFLKAGAARVVVPVKPEFTKQVLYFTETGSIWIGENTPSLAKRENVSMVDEVQEANVTFFEQQIGEKWDLVVPTNLVYLNPDVTPELPNYE